MAPALIILTGLFLVLLVGRVGAARRRALAPHLPALAFAAAAFLALARGAWTLTLILSALAGLAWLLTPILRERGRVSRPQHADAADMEAARLLGVQANATEQAIRRAYREKMAQAHPDRGGSHNEAARLTAARDRLLRKRRA
jgi:DnaJ domain